MTSPSSTPTPAPSQDPNRPDSPSDAALFDAVAAEHGVIYGYGIVSAHSNPAANSLVSTAMREHRARREWGVETLTERGVTPPLPAAGYRLPLDVDSPIEAAQLALRMEEDSAQVWRAVLEQAGSADDRAYAVTALTEAAVTSAMWRTRLGTQPTTVPFPGGQD